MFADHLVNSAGQRDLFASTGIDEHVDALRALVEDNGGVGRPGVGGERVGEWARPRSWPYHTGTSSDGSELPPSFVAITKYPYVVKAQLPLPPPVL
jgi:hypothetical protein